MPTLTRDSRVSMSTTSAMYAVQWSGELVAGEAIDAGAPCYVSTADGKVYMTNGTADNAAAKTDGFAPVAYAVGAQVTLYGPGAVFHYGSGLGRATRLFASATKGRLDDAATVGGTTAIARVVNDTDIQVLAFR